MDNSAPRMGQQTQTPETCVHMEAEKHSEGMVAGAIERQTGKLPSDAFLWAAAASIGGSILLQCMDRKNESRFVGQWAPTFLILGLYNKVVKVAGSDRAH